MKEYQVENYILNVGYSKSEETTEIIIKDVVEFEKTIEVANRNKIVYCYTADKYKELKGIVKDNNILKSNNVIGITESDIIFTTESLDIEKELVFKISKVKNRYK